MPALMSGARLFAFPSWYEGFGIAVLEAMSCGIPAIVSSAGALPEVIGDSEVVFDGGADDAGLASLMARVLNNPGYAAQLGQRNLTRSSRFSPAETARQTLGVYHGNP